MKTDTLINENCPESEPSNPETPVLNANEANDANENKKDEGAPLHAADTATKADTKGEDEDKGEVEMTPAQEPIQEQEPEKENGEAGVAAGDGQNEPDCYAFRWEYGEQYRHDHPDDLSQKGKRRKNPKKKNGAPGAFTYALIMITTFLLAFSILAASLAWGNIADWFEKSTAGKTLTLPEIIEIGMPSSVSIVTQTDDLKGTIGSGFVLNTMGYIATNYHVVEKAKSIVVVTSDQKSYSAELVGFDAKLDLAVLYVNVNQASLKAALLGDSDAVQLGETVVAIGTPYSIAFGFSPTNGIVSGLNRVLSSGYKMIQTNASVNPGNSGGPLFDSHGNVIGIVTSKLMTTTEDDGTEVPLEGMGFAIPINTAKPYFQEFITQDLNRPMLGITAVVVKEGKDYYFDGENGRLYGYVKVGNTEYREDADGNRQILTEAERNRPGSGVFHAYATGVAVTDVTRGLGADGKLQRFDVIVQLNDTKITGMNDVKKLLQSLSAGDSIQVTYVREGKTQTQTMQLKTKRDMLAANAS